MTCPSVQDDLKAYADGELSLMRRLAVRRHLAGCAPCRREIQSMEALHKDLRAAEVPDAGLSADLRARILSQVADVTPLPTAHPPSRLLQYGFAGSLIVNCFFLLMLSRVDLHGTRRTPPPQPGVAMPAQQPPAPTPHKPPLRAARPLPPSALPRSVTPSASTRPSVARPFTSSPMLKVAPPLADASGQTQAPPRAVTRIPVAPPPAPDAQTFTVDGQSSPAPAARPAFAPPAVQDRAAKPSAQAPPPAPSGQAAPPPPPPAPARAAGEAKAGAPDGNAPAIEGDWAQVVLPTDFAALTPGRTTVTADWAVDAQGRVSDIRFPSIGSPAVDEAVREAVRKSHFVPAARGGVPVGGRMSHTFVVVP